MSDDKHDRRDFFREGLARMAGPLADFLTRGQDIISPAESAPERLTRHTQPVRPLRPPGAVPEMIFARTCDHSGKCVDACPANAIKLTATTAESDELTPSIDATVSACVVCDGLLCTHVCPSGALRPLTAPEQINMGLAKVDAALCVCSETDGGESEYCTICVDACPIGESALRFMGSGPPAVIYSRCVGCGICQQHCPTDPRAIVVEPR